MVAEFEAYTAQHEQPEDDHERKIEAAESGGVEQRKGEIERASSGEKPDFVAVPHGADGAKAGLALGFGAYEEEMKHADTEVESIENDIADDHYGNQPKPDKTHHDEKSSMTTMLSIIRVHESIGENHRFGNRSWDEGRG